MPDTIKKGIAHFTNGLLNQFAMRKEQIDYYAIHPGGLKILQACEQALEINEYHNRYAYQILRDFGNMSSATVLFLLKAIWNDFHNQKEKQTIFSCAFGPGLTLEAMILAAVIDDNLT